MPKMPYLLRIRKGVKVPLKTTKPSPREGLNLIGAAGFEPTTPTTPKWYATKLRYAPLFIRFLIVGVFVVLCKRFGERDGNVLD